MNPNDLGDFLHRNKMTGNELAAKLGVHWTTISRWRNGREPKGSHLHIRVTQAQKARWVKKAQARGIKLSAWVCERLEDEKRG